MTPHRFFAADVPTYEHIRSVLDSAWGLPNTRGTITCLRPAADNAPRDSAGRVLCGVSPEWCSWEPAATLLPQLLASGVVEEIDEATYMAAVQPVVP